MYYTLHCAYFQLFRASGTTYHSSQSSLSCSVELRGSYIVTGNVRDQARNHGGARGAFAPPLLPPRPTGPKGPHFDTQYPVQVKECSRLN